MHSDDSVCAESGLATGACVVHSPSALYYLTPAIACSQLGLLFFFLKKKRTLLNLHLGSKARYSTCLVQSNSCLTNVYFTRCSTGSSWTSRGPCSWPQAPAPTYPSIALARCSPTSTNILILYHIQCPCQCDSGMVGACSDAGGSS